MTVNLPRIKVYNWVISSKGLDLEGENCYCEIQALNMGTG